MGGQEGAARSGGRVPCTVGRHPGAGRREPRMRAVSAAAAPTGRAAAARPAHRARLMTVPRHAPQRAAVTPAIGMRRARAERARNVDRVSGRARSKRPGVRFERTGSRSERRSAASSDQRVHVTRTRNV